MIEVNKNIVRIEGDSKDLCVELTYLLSSFKDTMIKEFEVSEENISLIMAECFKIAFMSNIERKQYLDELLVDYKNKH
jgi:hypothetical protein